MRAVAEPRATVLLAGERRPWSVHCVRCVCLFACGTTSAGPEPPADEPVSAPVAAAPTPASIAKSAARDDAVIYTNAGVSTSDRFDVIDGMRSAYNTAADEPEVFQVDCLRRRVPPPVVGATFCNATKAISQRCRVMSTFRSDR